jgi:hypothetical protein
MYTSYHRGLRLENPEQSIALRDDGQTHHATVVLGEPLPREARSAI